MEINVQIVGEEVLLRLDQLPKAIRQSVTRKFEAITARIESEMLAATPGRYIGKERVRSGVETLGGTLIGYVEVDDKPGEYSIFPSKQPILKFIAKSGDLVRTRRVLHHPFLKGAPVVARYLLENKPWIVDQIENAVIEAL